MSPTLVTAIVALVFVIYLLISAVRSQPKHPVHDVTRICKVGPGKALCLEDSIIHLDRVTPDGRAVLRVTSLNTVEVRTLEAT